MTKSVREIQLPMFGLNTSRIVNVASVQHRSPFRYPGGKTWLVPFVQQWMLSQPKRPAEFIEPFAGGAIIGLTIAFEKLADHVTLVELDQQVAAVWKTILEGDYQWLADQILNFDLNLENVEVVFSQTDVSTEEKAFQTILKNRIHRGGILAPGAGKIKHGENGKGIKSRWYPETLAKRILNIGRIRERISFIQGDGVEVLQEETHRSDVAFFIDPPYTAAGKKAGARLYTHYELDHERLFSIVENLAGDFLMTYDNAPEIQAMAEDHGFSTEPVAMKNTHHTEMIELLVGKDLGWII